MLLKNIFLKRAEKILWYYKAGLRKIAAISKQAANYNGCMCWMEKFLLYFIKLHRTESAE